MSTDWRMFSNPLAPPSGANPDDWRVALKIARHYWGSDFEERDVVGKLPVARALRGLSPAQRANFIRSGYQGLSEALREFDDTSQHERERILALVDS